MYKSEGKKDSGNLQLCWRKLWLQCMWRTIQWLHLLNCSPDYFVLISFFKPIRIHKKWVLNRTGSFEPEVGLDISTSSETLKKVVCWWSPAHLTWIEYIWIFFSRKYKVPTFSCFWVVCIYKEKGQKDQFCYKWKRTFVKMIGSRRWCLVTPLVKK